jgi:hypothetical protein
MSHNYTSQSASLYANLRPTKSAISTFAKFNRVLAELVGCLLEENTAKDKTIKMLQTQIQNLEEKRLTLEKQTQPEPQLVAIALNLAKRQGIKDRPYFKGMANKEIRKWIAQHSPKPEIT